MSIDQKLLACIMDHKKDTRIEDFNSVFMYVKNYCPYSVKAAKLAAELVVKRRGDVTVLDVLTNNIVSANNLKVKLYTASTHYIQAYKPLSGFTVPQIHLYNGEWKYIGGCSPSVV